MDAKPLTPVGRIQSQGLLIVGLLLAFFAAALVATRPLSVDLETRLPANADALHGAWILKTVCDGFGQPANIFRGNMFFPDTASLLYSEPLLGQGIQVAPLCVAGLDHVTLFNLTFAVILAMCALGAWLLAREITGSAAAALVGATVFAFTTANYDSAARLQIVAGQWTPFCLLYLIRFSKQGRVKDAVLMGVSFAMQAWSCTYYEIFLGLLLVLATPFWTELAGGLANARKRIPGVAAAAIVALALVLPLNLAQRLHLDPILVSRPQAQEVTLSFFTEVLPTNLLYGGLMGRPRLAYDALYFPGLLPLIFAAGFLFWRSRRRSDRANLSGLRAICFVGGAAFLLAFGARVATPFGEIPGPLALFSAVPGLGQARVPSRFFMFSRLALAMLAAGGAHQMLGRFKRQWVMTSILSLACFAEHWSTPLDSWIVPTRAELPKVYEWLEQTGTSSGPILEFPPSLQRLRREEATWLHVGAFHGVPMANGYSSFRPAWFEFVMEAALRWPDDRLLRILRQIGIRTIVVHPRPRDLPELDGATVALLDYAASHPEQLRPVMSFADERRWDGLWSRLGDEKVFQVEPQTSRPTVPREPAMDRSGWTCKSTEPGCELALDGEPATLLLGRDFQGPGQSLKIRFKEPARIDTISIGLGRSPELFPRDPVIRVLNGDVWTAVEASLDIEAVLTDMMNGSNNPAMMWRFPSVIADGFEIRLRSGGHRFREFGIPEINAHLAPKAVASVDSTIDGPLTETRPR